MTKPEFPGATLTADQWEQVNRLATSLDREQAIWISGYFAGLSHQARASATASGQGVEFRPPFGAGLAAAPATRLLTILFGSETGNSKGLAKSLAEAAQTQGIEARLFDMADYKTRGLRDEQDLLVVVSTHGEGDPPQTALGFFEFLESRKAPKLPQLRFAVLALGDSTYEHYCGAGKRIDRRLEELGAQRLAERVDCDVDYEDAAAAWTAAIIGKLGPTVSALPATPIEAAARRSDSALAVFDKKHPFQAAVIDNIVLTGRSCHAMTS